MTSVTFTGSFGYVSYLIERKELEGWEVVDYKRVKNRKFGELIKVTMEKKCINFPLLTQAGQKAYFDGETFIIESVKSVHERLEAALEREDYELAAILRDQIKAS